MTSSSSLCGWMGNYQILDSTDPTAIRSALQRFISDTGLPQSIAWDRSIPIVQSGTSFVLAGRTDGGTFNAVFEYLLPREGGRRPDVVLLQNGVVVLEFKDTATLERADLDQVAAYARDLKHYHEECHTLDVLAVLIPTRYRGENLMIDGVTVLAPNALGKFLIDVASRQEGHAIDPQRWIAAEYMALPTLVKAARLLFERQPLPRIKRAESVGLPQTLKKIIEICHEAAATGSRHLVLLTGVPGAGKTLVGLQLAHHEALEDLRSPRPGNKNGGAPAAFLSGNGPLVQVLQDALGSTVFVAGMKKFIEYYLFRRPDLVPPLHVIIFDEAQRAWDKQQMASKHQGSELSEPMALLQIAARVPDWCVVLGLVGEGQEIHKGEEAGLRGWTEAITAHSSEWTIHGPGRLSRELPESAVFVPESTLNLSTTLRSHTAGHVHRWVSGALDGGIGSEELSLLASELRKTCYPIYLTRQIETAKEYVKQRYKDESDKRFGLLASRYAKNLSKLGIDNVYHFERVRQLNVAKWFNSEPNESLSCCALSRPACEFDCQGLELDLPILCWGDDLFWNEFGWKHNIRVRRSLKDPFKVTLNAYRVLMTRGRDGLVIFIPRDESLDATASRLISCGVQQM